MRKRVSVAQTVMKPIVKHDWTAGANCEQREVIEHDKGPLRVLAAAGSGKTFVACMRVGRLIDAGVPADRILMLTFTRKAGDEMAARIRKNGGHGARVGTFHSLCIQMIRQDGLPQSSWETRESTKMELKDIVGFRGMNWLGVDVNRLMSFIGICKAKLIESSDDAAEVQARKLGIYEAKRAREAYHRYQERLAEKNILTFDDYITIAEKHLREEENRLAWAGRYDYVICDEDQDTNLAQRRIVTALSRDHQNIMVVGDFFQCHPPGVMVEVSKGESIPIERLKNGDRVRAWNRKSQKMLGGRSIEIAERPYSGPLFRMSAAERSVEMTPNHRVLVRWTDRGVYTCVTYLMWRKDLGFRVGWCQLFSPGNNKAFHLAHRARLENADKVWILGVHEDRTGASIEESVIAARFGIPTVTFEPVHGAKHLTRLSIDTIFAAISSGLHERGLNVLASFNRDFDLPLYPWSISQSKDDTGRIRGTYFECFASNLIPGHMSIPLPDATNAWTPIDTLTTREYRGPVYSLDVAEDHSYAANGLVVLNSIYSWRGAEPGLLASFESDWPGAKTVVLPRNYRSRPEIIRAANGIVGKARIDGVPTMVMVPTREEPGKVMAVESTTFDDEANNFVSWVRTAVDAGDSKLEDHCCLFRVNAQSRALEDALIANRLPYVIVGGLSFYERKEVKDLLAYLRLAEGRGGIDDIKRCINAPFRFLGAAFVARVQAAFDARHGEVDNWGALVRDVAAETGIQARQVTSAADWASLVAQAKRMHEGGKLAKPSDIQLRDARPASILEYIIRTTRYIDWIQKEEGEESIETSGGANVREMCRVADRFSKVEDLLDYVTEMNRAAKRQREDKQAGGDRVLLMNVYRCVSPDTLVETREGLLPIREIPSEGEIGTVRGPMRYRGKVVNRASDMLRITTTSGYAIEVTPTHGMMTWDGRAYTRVEAHKLKIGKFLRLVLGERCLTRGLPILPSAPEVATQAHRFRVPGLLTPDVAELFGLIVADGTLTGGSVVLKKRHADVVSRFVTLAADIFGIVPTRNDRIPLKHGGFYSGAWLNSMPVVRWFQSIGGFSPRAKAVPRPVLCAPLDVQAGFLRGLFEDGTVNVKGTRLDHVSLTTTYSQIARTVQTMLLRFGIISSRVIYAGCWRVQIYGINAKRFVDRIGFVSAFKNNLAETAKAGPEDRYIIPVVADDYRGGVLRWGKANRFHAQNAAYRGYVSRDAARKLGTEEDALAFHHERIASIESFRGPSVCVEVPEHGRFIQNGFDGSNSKGLEWPRVWIAGCNEMLMPHVKGDPEEERRVMYVAATRARDEMVFSHVSMMSTRAGIKEAEPSRFLEDAFESLNAHVRGTDDPITDTDADDLGEDV